MASEHTQNYNLSRWTLADEVRMEDFNSDNEKIDAALAALGAGRVAVGSYTGDGAASQTIPLPFTPAAVFLFVTFGSSTVYQRAAILTRNFLFLVENSLAAFSTSDCALLENGLKVAGTAYNYSGKVNHYIAIR